MAELQNFPQKLAIAVPLLYAIGLTVWCPCEKVLSCHWAQFLAALGSSLALTLLFQFY